MERRLSMVLLDGHPALVDQNGRPALTGICAGIIFDGGKSNRQTRLSCGEYWISAAEGKRTSLR